MAFHDAGAAGEGETGRDGVEIAQEMLSKWRRLGSSAVALALRARRQRGTVIGWLNNLVAVDWADAVILRHE